MRVQLPAYSPLRIGSILRGVAATSADPERRLEALLVERFECERATLCGSGTQALTLAIRACAAGNRPRVALPAYGCFDLVSAAVGADALVTFYDVDPATLGPDGGSLHEACRGGVDAVVVASWYGMPVDWAQVEQTLGPGRPVIIEDAAQGIGASWNGRPVGTLGDVSVLSFGRGKGWTGGTGGALLDRRRSAGRAPLAGRRPRTIPLAIKVAAQWTLGRPALFGIPGHLPFLKLGETEYHDPVEAAPMPRLAAALVLSHADLADREAVARRRNAERILERAREALGSLETVGFTVPTTPLGAAPGHLRLPLLAGRGIAGFPDARAAWRAGVMPGYPAPLPELPVVAGRRLSGPETPGAAAVVQRLFTLPTHSLLVAADVDRLVELLRSYRA